MFAVDAKALTPADLVQRWHELAPLMPEDQRAEIDEFGEFLLAPLPTNRHRRLAGWVAGQLQRALGGEIGSFAIGTRIGVRVPDMCWTADASRFEADPATSAPEICIEIASPGNTTKWLLEKAAAYLAAGAVEVIVVELDGRTRYFDAAGERSASSFGVVVTLPPR